MSESRFLSALETLYQAALEPEKWIAFLDQFGPIINAIGGHYYIWDQSVNGITFGVPSSHYTDADNQSYIEYWGAHDRMRIVSMERGGEWLLNDRVFEKQYITNDAFHNEYLQALDLRYIAGYRTNSETPASSAISFGREIGQQPLGDTEIQWLSRLRPHLELAGKLHREMMRLRLSAALQEQALFALDYPILLVYENGAVAFLNAAAERWLATNGVIGLKCQRLVGTTRRMQDRLTQLIGAAYRERVSGIQPIARSGSGQPYQMMVIPLNPLTRIGSVFYRPISLIVVSDPQVKASLTNEHLQTLFGLTLAEARVCRRLAEGKTLEEAALEANVSINTARTQLKQALKKTGTRRQAELIAIISAMPRLTTGD